MLVVAQEGSFRSRKSASCSPGERAAAFIGTGVGTIILNSVGKGAASIFATVATKGATVATAGSTVTTVSGTSESTGGAAVGTAGGGGGVGTAGGGGSVANLFLHNGGVADLSLDGARGRGVVVALGSRLVDGSGLPVGDSFDGSLVASDRFGGVRSADSAAIPAIPRLARLGAGASATMAGNKSVLGLGAGTIEEVGENIVAVAGAFGGNALDDNFSLLLASAVSVAGLGLGVATVGGGVVVTGGAAIDVLGNSPLNINGASVGTVVIGVLGSSLLHVHGFVASSSGVGGALDIPAIVTLSAELDSFGGGGDAASQDSGLEHSLLKFICLLIE